MTASASAQTTKVQVDAAPNMTPEQKVQAATACVEQMDDTISGGLAALESARAASDIERISCINDALRALKKLRDYAKKNLSNLELALANGQDDEVEHEYIKISIACGKSDEYNAQLQSCGGPDLSGTVDGQPVIEASEDPGLPQFEVQGDVNETPDVFAERPESQSPVL